MKSLEVAKGIHDVQSTQTLEVTPTLENNRESISFLDQLNTSIPAPKKCIEVDFKDPITFEVTLSRSASSPSSAVQTPSQSNEIEKPMTLNLHNLRDPSTFILGHAERILSYSPDAETIMVKTFSDSHVIQSEGSHSRLNGLLRSNSKLNSLLGRDSGHDLFSAALDTAKTSAQARVLGITLAYREMLAHAPELASKLERRDQATTDQRDALQRQVQEFYRQSLFECGSTFHQLFEKQHAGKANQVETALLKGLFDPYFEATKEQRTSVGQLIIQFFQRATYFPKAELQELHDSRLSREDGGFISAIHENLTPEPASSSPSLLQRIASVYDSFELFGTKEHLQEQIELEKQAREEAEAALKIHAALERNGIYHDFPVSGDPVEILSHRTPHEKMPPRKAPPPKMPRRVPSLHKRRDEVEDLSEDVANEVPLQNKRP